MQQLREELASLQALVTQMAVAQAAVLLVLQIQAASFVISPTVANDGIFSELSTTKRTRLFKVGSEPGSEPMFDFLNGSDLHPDGNPRQAASMINTRRTNRVSPDQMPVQKDDTMQQLRDQLVVTQVQLASVRKDFRNILCPFLSTAPIVSTTLQPTPQRPSWYIFDELWRPSPIRLGSLQELYYHATEQVFKCWYPSQCHRLLGGVIPSILTDLGRSLSTYGFRA
jgi:hypothetical protein